MAINQGYWMEVFTSTKTSILGLKELSGKPLVIGSRRVGFIGFFINMKSMENIFKDFVTTKVLSYLLTFKFSQDHIEAFFLLQEETVATITTYLCRNFSTHPNCLDQDTTECLNIFESKNQKIAILKKNGP